MEHLRLLLAIFLTIIVFLLWELLFVPEQPVKPPAGPADSGAPSEVKPASPAPDTQNMRQAEEKPVAVPKTTVKTVTVETNLYRAVITEKGAAIRSFVLKHYRADGPGGEDPKNLVPKANHAGTALVHLVGAGFPDISGEVFTTRFRQSRLKVDNASESISFFWESGQGLVVEKRYTFHPDSYGIGLAVKLVNQAETAVSPGLLLEMTNPPPSGSTFVFQGPFAYINQELEEIDIDDIAEKNVYAGPIAWAGIEDRYFMTALVPENVLETEIRLALESSAKPLLRVGYFQPPAPVPAGGSRQYAYRLYMGPKRMSDLNRFGHDLEEAINFGFFDIIAKPCLWLMNQIHDHVIANYGVAIILLTLIFKIIFWPLGNKSYRSMAEMKKLQPLMTEIRKKYKDDKKKMNEEVMRLYRTYKVNPMSGCLPMVVQIPVFIAFYRMLYEAIELRHAPFLLWINDLSAPDRLFRFDVSIPFMAPPYGIPVLTIIMGATMFLQQKISPPPGDPSQAKFMMMMPLIFTVIFINFPSGLVLYWLTNNVFSIAQQYYITRKTV